VGLQPGHGAHRLATQRIDLDAGAVPRPTQRGRRRGRGHIATPGHPLAQASLPHGPGGISIEAVALIPGTTDLLAGGDTHASDKPGTNVVAVLLQYGI
jgi:hypothetical protein